MAHRNLARLAAPLALLAAAVGVAGIVVASRSSAPQPSSATSRSVTTEPTRSARPRARAYVVKAGDTLTVIAERTDVTLETLERLNPDVDPQALQTGQRLKLTP
jgi:LysM repeat protein